MLNVVAGQDLVLCSYCSIEMKRKRIKEHTEKKHGKNVPIKEKLLAGQQLLSSHFALKRKHNENTDGGESSEPKNNKNRF